LTRLVSICILSPTEFIYFTNDSNVFSVSLSTNFTNKLAVYVVSIVSKTFLCILALTCGRIGPETNNILPYRGTWL